MRSNGKTSTKDLTASVLGEHFQVTRTDGNLNNHIGVPLTLLRARRSDQIGVFEMGMNHPGEIAPLAAMAAPDVAIITNIGMAHIEFMGSREAIALEKGMLAEALQPSGTLILSAHDEFSPAIAARTKADTVLAGIGIGEVFASELRARIFPARNSGCTPTGAAWRRNSPCPANTWCATPCSLPPRAASLGFRWKNVPMG